MPNYFPFGMPYWHLPYYRIPNKNKKKSSTTNTNYSSTANNYNYDSNTDTGSYDNLSRTNHTNENDTSFINLFGFNLYSDDVLIFCILFFLYSEGIKDEMLFICLILLLLS